MAQEQAAAAVQAAVDAAPGWRATSAVTRGDILRKAGGKLREPADEIADVLRREAGKPRADALAEVLGSAKFLEYYGGLGRGPQGEVLADVRPGAVAQTRREPLGVVAAITPWNDPLLTPARKLGPALVTGNTVVLKPASYTPIVSQELARAFAEAGLPAGVLNTVTGAAGVVGPVLTEHPAIDAVTFTGSTAVGKDLRRPPGGHRHPAADRDGRQERRRGHARRRPVAGRHDDRGRRLRRGRPALYGDQPADRARRRLRRPARGGDHGDGRPAGRDHRRGVHDVRAGDLRVAAGLGARRDRPRPRRGRARRARRRAARRRSRSTAATSSTPRSSRSSPTPRCGARRCSARCSR